jgi:phage gpG-like protein
VPALRFGSHDPLRIVARNEAVKGARGIHIEAYGLRELRAAFRQLPPAVDKNVKLGLRRAAIPVRGRARELAPRKTGTLARSLTISVQRSGVAITSRIPYANVQHWGGSTGKGHMENVPWSGSIFVEPTLFLSQALSEHEGEVMDEMARAIDRAAAGTAFFGRGISAKSRRSFERGRGLRTGTHYRTKSGRVRKRRAPKVTA